VPEPEFDRLVEVAESDPSVVALMLGGGRGRGFVTPESDYDVFLVFGGHG
jgi:hypothetical protein